MENEELWSANEDNQFEKKSSKVSMLRISILFACGAIAAALVITPMVSGGMKNDVANSSISYDNIVTGSINAKSQQKLTTSTYTIRRSVTQSSNETCIVYTNSLKTNGCK